MSDPVVVRVTYETEAFGQARCVEKSFRVILNAAPVGDIERTLESWLSELSTGLEALEAQAQTEAQP